MPGRFETFLGRIFITTGEPRLRAGWRILVMFSILFITSLFLVPLLLFGNNLEQNTTFSLFLNAFLSALPITLATFISRKKIDRRTITSLGFSHSQKAIKDLIVGIGIAGVMLACIFLINWLFGWYEQINFQSKYPTFGNLLIQLLIFFVIFILVGWGEELLFRGYLFINIQEGLNKSWSIVLTSFLFAIAHYSNPNFNFAAILGLFFSGILFATSRIWSKALYLPIGLHIGWNFFEGPILGFPVSGLKMGGILETVISGPEVLTGGSFGPEAGLILLPGLAVGLVLTYLYTRYL